MTLPDGLTARPLRADEAPAVHAVMAAVEVEAIGRAEVEEADIVADWQRPSFDPATGTLGVFDGDRLVAYGEYRGAGRSDAAVHPDWTGRGIGTHVAQWVRDTARAAGVTVVGMPVPRGSRGDRLLDDLGYHVRWTSWVLRLPEGTTVPDRPLPEGYTVREAVPDDLVPAHDVLEDAFLEWSERERETTGDFEAQTLRRPGFEPWMFRVVTDPSGGIAAVAIVLVAGDGEAYVDRLATRADQRHRGLAQALLVDAFDAGRAHGATSFGLSTDSRTGALGLYEKVGMVVTDVWVNRAATL